MSGEDEQREGQGEGKAPQASARRKVGEGWKIEMSWADRNAREEEEDRGASGEVTGRQFSGQAERHGQARE